MPNELTIDILRSIAEAMNFAVGAFSTNKFVLDDTFHFVCFDGGSIAVDFCFECSNAPSWTSGNKFPEESLRLSNALRLNLVSPRVASNSIDLVRVLGVNGASGDAEAKGLS